MGTPSIPPPQNRLPGVAASILPLQSHLPTGGGIGPVVSASSRPHGHVLLALRKMTQPPSGARRVKRAGRLRVRILLALRKDALGNALVTQRRLHVLLALRGAACARGARAPPPMRASRVKLAKKAFPACPPSVQGEKNVPPPRLARKNAYARRERCAAARTLPGLLLSFSCTRREERACLSQVRVLLALHMIGGEGILGLPGKTFGRVPWWRLPLAFRKSPVSPLGFCGVFR